jgi:hypothetical protein
MSRFAGLSRPDRCRHCLLLLAFSKYRPAGDYTQSEPQELTDDVCGCMPATIVLAL